MNKILKYIGEHPACTSKEIAKAVNADPYDTCFMEDLVMLENSGFTHCFLQIDPETNEKFYKWCLTKQGECAIIKVQTAEGSK